MIHKQHTTSESAEELLESIGYEIDPEWLSESIVADMVSTRDTLISDIHTVGDRAIEAEKTALGSFPAVTVTTSSGRGDMVLPVIQLLREYNAAPIAPRFTDDEGVSFDAIPVPDFQIGTVSQVQIKNKQAVSQSYTVTLTKALSRAGFTEGTEVSHYARPGEIKLTVAETPFIDSQQITPTTQGSTEYSSQIDTAAEKLRPAARSISRVSDCYPPQLRVTANQERKQTIFRSIPQLPVRISSLRRRTPPRPEGDVIDVTLTPTPAFTDLQTTTKIRQKAESLVVTVTEAIEQAGFSPDGVNGTSPRLGVYSRPGEIKITNSTG